MRDDRATLRPWGVVKDRGDRRTLLCDYDRPHPPRLQSLWRVLGTIGLAPVFIRYDRTARGWHVVVRVTRSLTSAEIVALQMALGSDAKRERFNLRRVLCGAPPAEFNLLFAFKLE